MPFFGVPTRNGVAVGLKSLAAASSPNVTVPGAPTIGTATQASSTSVSVTFSAPASDGGSPITSYTATSSPGGLTASGAGSPLVVTGLTTGVAYTFTVTATNAVGTGSASAASNSVTPAIQYAVWNSADKNAGITLSNGNKTAVTSGQPQYVRADTSKAAGKWYWEVTVDLATGLGIDIGVAFSTASLSTWAVSDADKFCYYGFNGNYNNGGSVAYGASFTVGDIIGVALDLTGNQLTFYKNNVSQGAIAISAGTYFPIYGSESTGATGVTANFGATALTYTPPAGFNSGIYS